MIQLRRSSCSFLAIIAVILMELSLHPTMGETTPNKDVGSTILSTASSTIPLRTERQIGGYGFGGGYNNNYNYYQQPSLGYGYTGGYQRPYYQQWSPSYQFSGLGYYNRYPNYYNNYPRYNNYFQQGYSGGYNNVGSYYGIVPQPTRAIGGYA